jgi:hypothetical protein
MVFSDTTIDTSIDDHPSTFNKSTTDNFYCIDLNKSSIINDWETVHLHYLFESYNIIFIYPFYLRKSHFIVFDN